MRRATRSALVVLLALALLSALAVEWYWSPRVRVRHEVKFVKPDDTLLELLKGGTVEELTRRLNSQPDLPHTFRWSGATMLHLAARYRRPDFVVLLLARGADPNARIDEGRAGEGTTALIEAALSGDVESARSLIAHGADRSVRDQYGRTALDLARKRGHQEVARALREPATTRVSP